ncbi:hypothetical protein [Azotobacter chroococcum]
MFDAGARSASPSGTRGQAMRCVTAPQCSKQKLFRLPVFLDNLPVSPRIQINTMFETTLAQLERVVADLLQQNRMLAENCSQLEQDLRQAREENDNFQLAALEQEEKQAATLARLRALVERAGASSVA